MICDRVIAEELPRYWQQFARVLLDCPETWYTWWTLESIGQRIVSGQAQLWVVKDEDEVLLWFMTEIQRFPRRKVLNVWWASGREFLKCVPAVLPMLKVYAQHVGARSMTMVGRPGFERWLKSYGIKVQTVTYTMEALDG